MQEQPHARFWFGHARLNGRTLALAVAAFTERSARMHIRKRLGPAAQIDDVQPVVYAHAWLIDFRPPDARKE